MQGHGLHCGPLGLQVCMGTSQLSEPRGLVFPRRGGTQREPLTYLTAVLKIGGNCLQFPLGTGHMRRQRSDKDIAGQGTQELGSPLVPGAPEQLDGVCPPWSPWEDAQHGAM